jgi:hypothetical protein
MEPVVAAHFTQVLGDLRHPHPCVRSIRTAEQPLEPHEVALPRSTHLFPLAARLPFCLAQLI